MGSKKKDLEIIYNLQWKNKSGNGGDKANIIGMYDIPATTLNWEIFKSYLLKNSGTVGEDVKVSYITDSHREFPIESQTDFQIALYAFRRKARMGDIVNLKLDRISEQLNHRNSRHSNDAETQFDTEPVSIVSSCCNSDSAPEWFLAFMNKFKQTLSEEITAAVSNAVSNIKPHTVSQPPCYHSRKSKAETTKRRKLPLLTGDGPHETTKDFIKSLKLEGKLEHKLEKLENKTKKLKEKKKALFSKSSDSDAAVGNSVVGIRRRPSCDSEDDKKRYHEDELKRSSKLPKEDEILQMDAIPVNTQEMVPHMLGGEIYLHQWKVINTGKSSWTSDTALMFTWGSKALRPLDTIVSVPYLKSGETGTVAVRLQIPNCPGQYECYFHFHHKGRRFGHWLGCQVIVDPFDLKGNKSVLETSYLPSFETSQKNDQIGEDVYNIASHVICYDHWQGTSRAADIDKYMHGLTIDGIHTEVKGSGKTCEPLQKDIYRIDTNVRDVINSTVEDIKLQDPTDTNCSSDSDNQSIISLSDSNSSKGIPSEFVVVPIPDCFQVEDPSIAINTEVKPTSGKTSEESSKPLTPEIIKNEISLENCDDNNNEDTEQNAEKEKDIYQDAVSNSGNKSDIVMVTLPEVNQDNEEYACVIVDGQKVMIPKKMIKSEYLKTTNVIESSGLEKPSHSGSSSPFAEVVELHDEKGDEPKTHNIVEKRDQTESQELLNLEDNDFKSHCSAAGSCFSDTVAEKNNRLFIFPQACPGYEVVQGTEVTDLEETGYTWSKSETKDMLKPTLPHPLISEPMPMPNLPTSSNNPFTTETITHVPNYQQTPPEERRAPSETEIKAAFQLTEEFVQSPIQKPVRSIKPESLPRQETFPEPSAPSPEVHTEETPPPPPVVHILPESLVNGAVNAVSSVARSVINRIAPQVAPGRWVNGHWVSTNPESTREANLQALAEMGFWNRDLNATLLGRYSDDLSRVVAELVQ